MYGALDISTSGMIAQRTRLEAIAANIANKDTILDEAGRNNPFQRRVAYFAPGDPKLLTFAIMGALAGLAGLIFAARLNVATPKAGLGFELDVIAACFIGGAAVTGGVGKIVGAVIGAFIIGVMNNGMSIMGIGIDWQFVIKGVVLMLAVFLDVYYKNKA